MVSIGTIYTAITLTLGPQQPQQLETTHFLENGLSAPILFHSIVSMKQGEILQARLLKGSLRDSDGHQHTDFIGFLQYETKDVQFTSTLSTKRKLTNSIICRKMLLV